MENDTEYFPVVELIGKKRKIGNKQVIELNKIFLFKIYLISNY